MIFVSSFKPSKSTGGGWLTNKLISHYRLEKNVMHIRSDRFWYKLYLSALGILLYPTIHPIFSRFPVFNVSSDKLLLNFSQTFCNVLSGAKSTIIVHDLQCQRNIVLKNWAISSEKKLLHKSSEIVCLSNRDRKIIRRYYKVPDAKIKNINSIVCSGIKQATYDHTLKTLFFIGSLNRKENRSSLKEFLYVFDELLGDLDIVLVGKSDAKFLRNFTNRENVRYLGYLSSLSQLDIKNSAAIVWMTSREGVKIKAVEALSLNIPILTNRNVTSAFDFKVIGASNQDGVRKCLKARWIKQIIMYDSISSNGYIEN